MGRTFSGRSAAWVAHSVRDAGVVGSNPTAPIFFQSIPSNVKFDNVFVLENVILVDLLPLVFSLSPYPGEFKLL